MNCKRIFIGVSGGVDSAASLLMLKEAGYEVIGVYLWLIGDSIPSATIDALDKLSSFTGVEIIIEDLRERFDKIIVKPFIQSYREGETPSPCAVCNPLIKWQALAEIADRNGGGAIATGHYCKVTQIDNLFYLTTGVDSLKDQSYYMWLLSQDILSRAVFPLGEKTKTEVKEYMCQHGWEEMASKRESMGVCFLNGLKCGEWLKSNGIEVTKGDILDLDNKIIGSHDGYPFYTLAQKKRLDFFDSSSRGKAIIDINCKNNQLVVGNSSFLQSDIIYLRDYQFVSYLEAEQSDSLVVKVRGIGVNPAGYCKISAERDGLLRVELLSDSAWAVTKGQPAVFYIDNRLVGGGIVSHHFKK